MIYNNVDTCQEFFYMDENILEIIDRIKQHKGLRDDDEVASALGMTKGNLSSYKTRQAIPYEYLSKFCRQERLSLDWLLTGEGPMRREPSRVEIVAENHALYNNVRKLDVFTLAGAGSPKDLTEYEPIDTIWMPASFAGPSIVPVKVRGDSMYPLIHNGAIVGVDREDRQIISGEIYAVWLPNEGAVIKRLFMGFDRVELKSENPIHPTLLIPLKELDEHFLLGRVKWVIQRM